MSFANLLNDLEELKKAQAPVDAGDKKIQAAGADAGGEDDPDKDKDGDGEDEGDAGGAKGNDGGEMTKSFIAVIDGEEQQVIDGTEMLKSLSAQVGEASAALAFIQAERASENEHLTKSMGLMVDLLKEQGALVKSLQAQVEKISNEGRGRKSVTQPTEEMAKSIVAPEKLNAGSFMMKANAAFDAGKISGKDLTVCDVAMRYGTDIDPAILNKIMVG